MQNFSKLALTFMTVLSMAMVAFATPYQIVIIRHGEKPAETNPPQVGSDQLTQQGCERAYSLPKFFGSLESPNPVFGIPAAIYAQAPNDNKKNESDDDSSLRPLQTILPTSVGFSTPVNATYIHDAYANMVSEILSSPSYSGGTVFIAWEHQAIPTLAAALAPDAPAGTFPPSWPDPVFDEAWVMTFSGAAFASFSIIPEYVLPTDNPQGGIPFWTAGPQTITAASPVLSPAIVSECSNNNALNALINSTSVNTSPQLFQGIMNEVSGSQ